MKRNTLDIKTVCECNRCLGCKTLHPQVSLIDLENPGLEQDAVKFEFYVVLLIENGPDGRPCCGRCYYDYSNATMVFLAPGEVFRMNGNSTLPGKGYLLAFHPDLLFRTSLRNPIGNYTFFSYGKDEALHLSQRETAQVVGCLGNIDEELHHAIDAHSHVILSRHIELLLDYCTRYYERQFITRENKNKAIVKKVEEMLDDYMATGRLQGGRLPAPERFAGESGLSVAYFNDLLKFETGRTLAEYFQARRLDVAKRLLAQAGCTPAAVASRLGFPSVQSFSLMFTKITGVAPAEYRHFCH